MTLINRFSLLACIFILIPVAGGYAMTSNDAYVKSSKSTWIIGTSAVQRTIEFKDGCLRMTSLIDKTDGIELVDADSVSSELSVSIGSRDNRITGMSGGWQLLDSARKKLKQGELQLDITLRHGDIEAVKTYVVYPKTSIIREWVTYRNAGTTPLRILDPGFLNISVKPGDLKSLDFNWMTGGWSAEGSWDLKTESLESGKTRRFDSYDPFPGTVTKPTGDGVNAKIMLNDRQIWPQSGWQYVKDAMDTIPFKISADVKTGDKLAFIVNMNENIDSDTTDFNPEIAFQNGNTHKASVEFSGEQGKDGWRYQYIEDGKWTDLVYYPGVKQWRKQNDNPTGTPFISRNSQHPDSGQDVARVWTASESGKVTISGSVCNIGNGSPYGFMAGSRFMAGSTSYAPWYALYAKDTKRGLIIGWDYFGHWKSSFDSGKNGAVSAQLTVAGHDQALAPCESLTTPASFIGLFRDDLDNAGNECLDWQYRYLWDYTRDGWFPAIRMLGYWMRGTAWDIGISSSGWAGGNGDKDSAFRKVFRIADLMRYIGADVYHRDHGWWDMAGEWNGPDFRTMGEYLRKYDMGQLIYAFIYSVDPQWPMLKEHPDWAAGEFLGSPTLDMSRPDVVEFLKKQLDGFANKWGPFEWRNDSFHTMPRDGNDTPLLAQDQNFREILRYFLDKHPDCAFQAVNGGGNYAGYDYVRYSSCIQFTDGGVGLPGNYYTSLLLPPDKVCHMPDLWDPDKYDKSTFRGLLSFCFDMTGDTVDPVKLDLLREQIDIYHYLQKQGVVGRWVKVYRPVIEGDDPEMYFQRMSGDLTKGIIITKHMVPGAVTIKPKGLLPESEYFVSFHERSGESVTKSGSDLMENGIYLPKVMPGELIYLNLPMHPGSKLDKEPPTAPVNVRKQWDSNLGYPGVGLNWDAAVDNNWVSYYEIWRNGKIIDKVAKGTYYFDHSAGADLASRYEILAVDGAGNASDAISASGPESLPSQIIDDGLLVYSGDWKHTDNEIPAYQGTLSFTGSKGSTARTEFEGRKVTLFVKLGKNCGKLSVSIDGAAPDIVDTYSADDIWGVGVYSKTLDGSGHHSIVIEVLGEHHQYSKDSFIYLDGIRIER